MGQPDYERIQDDGWRDGIDGRPLTCCSAGWFRHKFHQYDRARDAAAEFRDLFGERFWLEIQDHGLPEQQIVNRGVAKLARELGIGMVATNDCHYLNETDHEHHDALLCIGTATNLDDPRRLRFDGQGFYLKSGDEMAEVFRDHPSAVANTLEIAERCNLDLGIDTGEYHMPEFQVGAGETRESVLERQAWHGLRRRLGLDRRRRFDYLRSLEALGRRARDLEHHEDRSHNRQRRERDHAPGDR